MDYRSKKTGADRSAPEVEGGLYMNLVDKCD